MIIVLLKRLFLLSIIIFSIFLADARANNNTTLVSDNKEKNIIQYSLAYIQYLKNRAQEKLQDKKEEIEFKVKKNIAIAISCLFDYIAELKNKFYDGILMVDKKIEELHAWSKEHQ